MTAEVIQLRRPARQSSPAAPATRIERIEGLLNHVRARIEGMVPLTTGQRMAIVILFEHVLDEIDAWDDPHSGGAA